jgi:hypothetical protein
VLSATITAQRFQAVPRWDTQIAQTARDPELSKLALCDAFEADETSHPLSARERLGVRATEGPDHRSIHPNARRASRKA